jgi:putative transposase
MMKLSVQLQLKPGNSQADALRQTLRQANEAANYVSNVAWEQKIFGQFKLHKLVYSTIRSKFGLPAQIAVRVIAKVADSYKFNKSVKRTFKTYSALAYDVRNFSLFVAKGMVSLSTLNGRVKVPFVCGDRQRELLQHQFGEADLVYRKQKWYLFVTINVEEPPPELFTDILGIDLGIANIATDSDGESYRFQYHTGPIKRTWVSFPEVTAVMFQYHTGPIKSEHDRSNSRAHTECFNTTLVQLKGRGRRREGLIRGKG